MRTVESYVQYYKRWAENWEFQALLKARPIAGSAQLGARYARAIDPFVWESAARESFVESVQTMRARVTDNIPSHQVTARLSWARAACAILSSPCSCYSSCTAAPTPPCALSPPWTLSRR